jgi:Family of unknown function (DUF6544)
MTPREQFLAEVKKAGLPSGPAPSAPVTADEIAALPEPVRRYLGFMGVVGRPRDWSLRVGYAGRYRTAPYHRFKNCEAWTYTTGLAVARMFQFRMRYAFVLPVVGRDRFVDGGGRMTIRLFDLFTIERERGEACDQNGLVAFLNDAVLLAPALLFKPEVAWSAADDESFHVSLTDRGRTVSAHVLVDGRGAPSEFSTADRHRYVLGAPEAVAQARWTMLVDGWDTIDGRPVPTRAEATWHLEEGRFTYAELHVVPEALAFNVAPGM